MSQHLIIRKFGPIDEVSIEVKDILIFIGEQASGKSTISKAIFFFKSLRDELVSHLYQCYRKQRFDCDREINNFISRTGNKLLNTYGIYGLASQFPDSSYMEYKYGNDMKIKIEVKYGNKNSQDSYRSLFTSISFDDFFRETFSKLLLKLNDSYIERKSVNSNFLSSRELSVLKDRENSVFDEIEHEIEILFSDDRDLLFLPSGRNLSRILSQQQFNSDLESGQSPQLDCLTQDFIRRIDNVRTFFSQPFDYIIQEAILESDRPEDKEGVELAKNLIDSILKGSYRYKNGSDMIYLDEYKSILIDFASSGQQEVIWILLLIFRMIFNRSKAFLAIEEPEAHLFPVAQKEIIDLIALLANGSYESNQVILTTHSPYILSSFNNLLYAYNLGEKNPEEVNRVIDHHFWIDPNRLDAYILEDGKARSIVDSETKLIDSSEIDSASDIIVDTFDRLFQLEDIE